MLRIQWDFKTDFQCSETEIVFMMILGLSSEFINYRTDGDELSLQSYVNQLQD